jgi:hypothetical protein
MRAAFAPLAVALAVLALPAPAVAQGLELMPIAGYRFGGDLFEFATGSLVDRDGAPAAGAVIDIPIGAGLQFEALFSRQSAEVFVPGPFSDPPTRHRVVVDQYQAGGLQEFGAARIRPFLTGMLGLSRTSVPGDHEVRFTAAAGGGVKLFPWRTLGVRIDGRLFATFLDIDGRVVACTTGRCLLGLDTDVVWQAEFTAGLVIRLR